MPLLGQKATKLSAHILYFVFPHSNVSFMASQWCHCHAHPFYWHPSCSHC